MNMGQMAAQLNQANFGQAQTAAQQANLANQAAGLTGNQQQIAAGQALGTLGGQQMQNNLANYGSWSRRADAGAAAAERHQRPDGQVPAGVAIPEAATRDHGARSA